MAEVEEAKDTKEAEEEEGHMEYQIERAMRSRIHHFERQTDSLTFEGVRRLLEEDLGLETYALDIHKRFIKQYLLKELKPQLLKRDRYSCQKDPVKIPMETSPVKEQPTASPASGLTCPCTEPPKSRHFKVTARKDAHRVLAPSEKASVQYPLPQPVNKRTRCSGQEDRVQIPLETSPVKQPAASSVSGPTCPSTDPPKARRFKMTARKDAHRVLACSVQYPFPLTNKTPVPQFRTKSPIEPEQESFKPSPPPEATTKTEEEEEEEEDPDSFFSSLMKKTPPNDSEASASATSSSIEPPPTAAEIEQAKHTFRCLLCMSFPDILLSSETFEKTLNTLVKLQALGHDLQSALQLFKHAFPSLSNTYNSTKQRKAEVDNQLQQADELSAELNQGKECYQKLKTKAEDAQAEKKALKDQIFMLQLRLSQVDDQLVGLSSQKEVLFKNMKAKHIAFKKLEGELPLLSFTKSKLEADLADTETAWVNFRSRFGSL